MKRTLLIIAIFVVALTAGGLVLAQESAEKIPNPSEIKNYSHITKIGNSLYGIRIKIASTTIALPIAQPQITSATIDLKKITQPKITTTTLKLEKIAGPQEINAFERIKQIGTALWGVRKVELNKNTTSNVKKEAEIKPVKVPDIKKINIKPELAECVKTAIEEKDTALKAAITEHSQNIFTAIDARTACQKAAIDQVGADQSAANKVCVGNYQKATKENNKTFQDHKNINWQAYREDLKACLKTQTATSTSTTVSEEEVIIEDGENITE